MNREKINKTVWETTAITVNFFNGISIRKNLNINMQETTKNSNRYEKISNEQFIFSMELV